VTHGSDVRVKPTRIESLLGDRKSPHLVFSNSTSISVVLLNYMHNVKTEYSCRLKDSTERVVCHSLSTPSFDSLVFASAHKNPSLYTLH
jgi:hypothetical protein